jgi:hypothetical protein
MNYKSYLRDLKIDSVYDSINLEVSSPKIEFKSRSGRKIIQDLFSMGAVLVGSRALVCYSIDGDPILDRKPDDWDFVANEEVLFKICDKYNLSRGIKIDNDGNSIIEIEKHLVKFTGDYGGSTRLFATDITIIVKDLPNFIDTKIGRISTLIEILNEKDKLGGEKHISDLKQIIIRLKSRWKY